MTASPSLAAVIARGGVALIGVDTVYGLCCDAQDAAAAQRLVRLKLRASAKPTAVAFFSLQAALDALPELGPRTRAAVAALLPGPLTLLLPNPAGRFPLAGGPEARTLAEVPAQIRAGVDLALDRGQLPGTPSTVIDLGELEADGGWSVVRDGAVAASAVELALVGSWG